MTTDRFQSLKHLAALAAATMMIGWFGAAPAASAGGIGDDIGGAVGNATGTATDTVNDTTGSTTDTVTDTVGSTTDTVNDTVGSTTGTVGDTAGSAGGTVGDTTGNVTGGGGGDGGGSGTGTVTDTIGGLTGTTDTVTGGGTGGITSGGGSGSGDSVSGSGSGSGSTSGSKGGSGSGTSSGPGQPTTTITLPDGSTIEVPVLTGGSTDRRKISSDRVEGLSPDAAALRGMLAGFVESDSGAGHVDGMATGSESGTSFLDYAARAAAQAAKKLAFPMTLVVIVGIFVVGHGRIGRKDPKLMLAPVDNEEETLIFR